MGTTSETALVSRVDANGIEIAYQTFGERSATPVVLISGLGTQMLIWPEEFCRQLADAGHFVVRFDNRDIGLSTHLAELAVPGLRDIVARRSSPYGIDDMAGDVAGLLDALGLEAVHLIGVSMGGFIAQTLALAHPKRVRSLTLIMTSTGSRKVGRSNWRVLRTVLRRRADGRAAAIDGSVDTFRVIGSPGYAFDEPLIRDLATRSYDRAHDPAGQRRQLAAVATQHDRTAELQDLDVPTLVIHGLSDPVINYSGGLALARAIPHSRFMGFAGMGHDLPRQLWSEVLAGLTAQIARAEAPGAD
jgi:pimeloyl-ACP methyl ester carboxylesterase